jgi:hypothetical protein
LKPSLKVLPPKMCWVNDTSLTSKRDICCYGWRPPQAEASRWRCALQWQKLREMCSQVEGWADQRMQATNTYIALTYGCTGVRWKWPAYHFCRRWRRIGILNRSTLLISAREPRARDPVQQ